MKYALFLLFALAACGQPKTTTTTPPHTGEEHGELPPEVKAFHEILSPRWHAEKSDARTQDTCAAIPDFQARATTLAQMAPPAGADATRWSGTTGELGDAVTALDGACKGSDPAAFEPAFHSVHERFHAVMEAAGAPPHPAAKG